MAIELPEGRCESNDVLEALRLRAVHAWQLGYAIVDIAAILGVREETVSRWCSRYDQGGQEALPGDRTGRPTGSGRLLNREQEQGIQQALETQRPQEWEIPSALWTRQAVQALIKQRVGIRLPIRTVGESLSGAGVTRRRSRCGKPTSKIPRPWPNGWKRRIRRSRSERLRKVGRSIGGMRRECVRRASTVAAMRARARPRS